ncbi:hypothetical protein PIIN_10730 [Serendipita indica DSM 11827]|uniref:Uncharacterized protein n=1 Tax=Serendipita indica (strain DSM 11827) TaxID=1109443 RepID=G4TZJ9_SERID|nr:hypothetical protein PIIN_10730 [Serendipita indica DSM 11827]
MESLDRRTLRQMVQHHLVHRPPHQEALGRRHPRPRHRRPALVRRSMASAEVKIGLGLPLARKGRASTPIPGTASV